MTATHQLVLKSRDQNELFKIAFMNVLKQGEKSFDEVSNTCQYSIDGKHCAVGWCLTPESLEAAKADCEGQRIACIVAVDLLEVSDTLLAFLSALQEAHDRTPMSTDRFFRSVFVKRMREVANKFNLLQTFCECAEAAIAQGYMEKTYAYGDQAND